MKDYCYEMCVIFSPTIEQEREKHYSRLRDLLEKEGAELIAEKDWGLRKFAYPIQKHTSGFYSFYYFKAEAHVLRNISADFKIQEDVLRHMIIKKTIGKDIDLDRLAHDVLDESDTELKKMHYSDDEDDDYGYDDRSSDYDAPDDPEDDSVEDDETADDTADTQSVETVEQSLPYQYDEAEEADDTEDADDVVVDEAEEVEEVEEVAETEDDDDVNKDIVEEYSSEEPVEDDEDKV